MSDLSLNPTLAKNVEEWIAKRLDEATDASRIPAHHAFRIYDDGKEPDLRQDFNEAFNLPLYSDEFTHIAPHIVEEVTVGIGWTELPSLTVSYDVEWRGGDFQVNATYAFNKNTSKCEWSVHITGNCSDGLSEDDVGSWFNVANIVASKAA
ncbi:hypothetical protein [Escherichia coli]|uniref:hypothetical protein n=1 Tax=Escherichia coli TaxID=562 RepID=UPI000E210E65|nr:hypothetical protein [Escherichia coli]